MLVGELARYFPGFCERSSVCVRIRVNIFKEKIEHLTTQRPTVNRPKLLPGGKLMLLPVEDIDVPQRMLVEPLSSTTLLNSRLGRNYSSY